MDNLRAINTTLRYGLHNDVGLTFERLTLTEISAALILTDRRRKSIDCCDKALNRPPKCADDDRRQQQTTKEESTIYSGLAPLWILGY